MRDIGKNFSNMINQVPSSASTALVSMPSVFPRHHSDLHRCRLSLVQIDMSSRTCGGDSKLTEETRERSHPPLSRPPLPPPTSVRIVVVMKFKESLQQMSCKSVRARTQSMGNSGKRREGRAKRWEDFTCGSTSCVIKIRRARRISPHRSREGAGEVDLL